MAKETIASVTTKVGPTILIVEDDEEVMDLAVRMLRSEDFKVITAIDANSGLEQFNRHPEIDLVFTDVIMPGGISGIQMSKKILKLKPETPIILVSGYKEKGETLLDNTFGIPNITYISKPYDVDEIPKLIDAMLDNNS